jgi:release factor glutamine methyltransferase
MQLSLLAIKELTEGYLQEKGVPNAKLETDLLIAHVLGMQRLDVYLNFDRPISAKERDCLRPLVKRRGQREPLQYILGYQDFCDCTLKVDPRALIPRPETEQLIERIVQSLAEPPARILDLGTGSGAIILALQQQYPAAQCTAVDVSQAALDLAQENERSVLEAPSIEWIQSDWWSHIEAGKQYDLIVSNPPYLTTAELASAEPEVSQFEPHTALVSGTEGLHALQAIFEQLQQRLLPDGLCFLETGIDQDSALQRACQQAGLQGQSYPDLSGRTRFFKVMKSET